MVRTDEDDGDGECDRNCRETFAAGNFWEAAGIENDMHVTLFWKLYSPSLSTGKFEL